MLKDTGQLKDNPIGQIKNNLSVKTDGNNDNRLECTELNKKMLSTY